MMYFDLTPGTKPNMATRIALTLAWPGVVAAIAVCLVLVVVLLLMCWPLVPFAELKEEKETAP